MLHHAQKHLMIALTVLHVTQVQQHSVIPTCQAMHIAHCCFRVQVDRPAVTNRANVHVGTHGLNQHFNRVCRLNDSYIYIYIYIYIQKIKILDGDLNVEE